MKTRDQLIAEYKEKHPVRSSRDTGLWGFERVQDCINLNKMTYRSERAAKVARHRAAVCWADLELDPERPGSQLARI